MLINPHKHMLTKLNLQRLYMIIINENECDIASCFLNYIAMGIYVAS